MDLSNPNRALSALTWYLIKTTNLKLYTATSPCVISPRYVIFLFCIQAKITMSLTMMSKDLSVIQSIIQNILESLSFLFQGISWYTWSNPLAMLIAPKTGNHLIERRRTYHEPYPGVVISLLIIHLLFLK